MWVFVSGWRAPLLLLEAALPDGARPLPLPSLRLQPPEALRHTLLCAPQNTSRREDFTLQTLCRVLDVRRRVGSKRNAWKRAAEDGGRGGGGGSNDKSLGKGELKKES
eukprot:COSAG04_NODE_2669_length_3757_cov_4.647348_5_plen_108_part_00